MFGWFKRKAGPAEQLVPRPHERADQFDQNGRPISPQLYGFSSPQDATDAQKMIVLLWAKAWCRYEGDVTETWLHGFNNAMIGKREKGERKGEFEEERRVLGMAVRALRLSAQRNRAERTAGAFPWWQLRLGPGDDDGCHCGGATAIEGQLIPWQDFPALPLPGCTAAVCTCWFRQVTKAEALKSGHGGTKQ